jgi:hypothetical protein
MGWPSKCGILLPIYRTRGVTCVPRLGITICRVLYFIVKCVFNSKKTVFLGKKRKSTALGPGQAHGKSVVSDQLDSRALGKVCGCRQTWRTVSPPIGEKPQGASNRRAREALHCHVCPAGAGFSDGACASTESSTTSWASLRQSGYRQQIKPLPSCYPEIAFLRPRSHQVSFLSSHTTLPYRPKTSLPASPQ